MVFIGILPLLITLGMWQLNRAEEKRAYISLLEERMKAPVLNLSANSQEKIDQIKYRNIELIGRYDSLHQFLIDNQIVDSKVGYFVLTPFLIQGGNKTVLVNRGWIPLGKNRHSLPDIVVSEKPTTITGRINSFPSVGIKMQGADIPIDVWPSTVQLVDTGVLEKKLRMALYPFQIELNKDQNNGYIRQWHITTPIPPEKHIAYAVQWFALGITLTVLFISLNLKKQ
jgi:surfeit locus 1 family protein